MSTGGLSSIVDDFHANWNFDRSPYGFVGGATISGGNFHARPIEYHPVPPGTPRWGKAWKEAMAKWYNRAMNIGSSGSVMANRYNYLDLDPTYRNIFGQPLMRMTFDYKANEHKISTFAAQVIDRLGKSAQPDHHDPAGTAYGPMVGGSVSDHPQHGRHHHGHQSVEQRSQQVLPVMGCA
jgi:gluconate 2-dehydrogenase alpha chain